MCFSGDAVYREEAAQSPVSIGLRPTGENDSVFTYTQLFSTAVSGDL